MIPLIYFFLPGIILLGIFTSYTDLKFGKIRNKHVVTALAYSFIVYLIIIVYVFVSPYIIASSYLIETAINILLALLVSYLMWEIGLWTPGDSKLFVAYSALVPIYIFQIGNVPFFQSMVILINTFVPVFLFYLLGLLFRTSWHQKFNALKSTFEPKKIILLAASLFAISWLFQFLASLLGLFTPVIRGILSNFFVMIFLLFLIMTYLERILRMNLTKISIVLTILRFAIDRSVFSIEFLKYFLILFLSFLLIRFFILELSFAVHTHSVDINLLKPGMVPAEVVYEEKGQYKKEPVLHFSFLSYLEAKASTKNYLFEQKSKGLTKEEVNKLHKLYTSKKIMFEHLKVQPTIPFALFMFLGVLLTLLFHGNFIIYLILRLL